MIEYSNLNETFITFIIKRFPELKVPHVILGNV